jgi:hypothetical protein
MLLLMTAGGAAMTLHKSSIAVFTTLVLSAIPALAHHAFSSEFDQNKPVSLSGTITKVDWSDPHVTFYMDAMNQSGAKENWKFEAASPNTLSKRNLSKDSVKVGDHVTFKGYRALDGSMYASARSMVLADGREVSVSDPAEDKGPQPQLTQTSQNSGALPHTASNVPAIGLLAFVGLAGAYAVRMARAS